MNEFDKQLKRIKSVIARGAGEADSEEILMEITQIIPPRVVNVEVEPKSSLEKLEYMKNWRAKKKRFEELLKNSNKKEEVRYEKIQHALKRTSFRCFHCNKTVECDSSLNKHSIEVTRGRNEERINISNECPHCKSKLVAFGGKVLPIIKSSRI